MMGDWTEDYTEKELDSSNVPIVAELMKDTVAEYTDLERADEDEPTRLGGQGTNADGLVTAILADPRISDSRDREKMREVYVSSILGDEEAELAFDDEKLEALGVEEDQYHDFRRDMIQVFERGLRGEIFGPPGYPEVSDDYNVKKFGESYFSLRQEHEEW